MDGKFAELCILRQLFIVNSKDKFHAVPKWTALDYWAGKAPGRDHVTMAGKGGSGKRQCDTAQLRPEYEMLSDHLQETRFCRLCEL
jgi:hypothetical protein